MKNKVLRKMGIYILAGGMVITPVMTSACFPVTVYADEIVVEENRDEVTKETTVSQVQETFIVTTNNGTIKINEGTVTYNNGTIESITNLGKVENNNEGGEITTNNGAVYNNNGKIGKNENQATACVEENGTKGEITTNDGKVNKNKGTVKKNDGNGTVTNNIGTVATNTGTVETNNGTVENNSATVENNFGTVKNNNNLGTVATNTGTVKNNIGTVTNNNDTGTVENNIGTVATNAATVKNNYGTVNTNNSTIEKNFGTVSDNQGTVKDNYGNASANGTVLNQWVLISTNLDAVEINYETDSSITGYIGSTIRKEQIEGVETESILDDKEAIFVHSNTAAYIMAASAVTKVLIPDETNETTQSFISDNRLVYDSSTGKTWISVQGIEGKIIELAFRLVDKEITPVTPTEPSGEPSTPTESSEDTNSSSSENSSSDSASEVTASVNQNNSSKVIVTISTTPEKLNVVPSYSTPEKQTVAVASRVNNDGTTTNVEAHVDGSVSETTKSSASVIAKINSDAINMTAPTVVNNLSVVVNKESLLENAKISGVTAVVDVATINGNVNLTPQMIANIKNETSSLAGNKTNVDLKVNTLAADGKPVSVSVSTDSLKNNSTLKGYVKDPLTGGYILVDIPNVKYDQKTGLSVSGLQSGLEYKFVSSKEAKEIEKSIVNSIKVSDEFANPVPVSAGSVIDMTKALSPALNVANVSKVVYSVSGNKATIDPVTGQLMINGNATKGTITVSIKVTLTNGKTKTVKTKIKIG